MPPQTEATYKLLSAVDGYAEGEPTYPIPAKRSCTRIRDCLLVVQALIILSLMIGLLGYPDIFKRRPECQVLYSPAQEAIAYETKLWNEDVWTAGLYRGEPSDEVDAAWSDLYNDFGISQIPKWQAQLLPNATLPIPADPENHILQLSVFHQIHCLNTIRKALSPEHYVDPATGDLEHIKKENLWKHLSHCVDSIRQGLMCAADISPIVWQWKDDENRAIINMNVVHSCRNYDMVVDWAKAHRIKHHFDPLARAE